MASSATIYSLLFFDSINHFLASETPSTTVNTALCQPTKRVPYHKMVLGLHLNSYYAPRIPYRATPKHPPPHPASLRPNPHLWPNPRLTPLWNRHTSAATTTGPALWPLSVPHKAAPAVSSTWTCRPAPPHSPIQSAPPPLPPPTTPSLATIVSS